MVIFGKKFKHFKNIFFNVTLRDVVETQCGQVVLELVALEAQTLLLDRDAHLVLDDEFHVVDCGSGIDVQGDGLACSGLHEDLNAGILI